jgi:hypothetical protein
MAAQALLFKISVRGKAGEGAAGRLGCGELPWAKEATAVPRDHEKQEDKKQQGSAATRQGEERMRAFGRHS